MRTAPTYWGRSQASARTSTLVIHRPDQINWVRVALQFVLGRLVVCMKSNDPAAKQDEIAPSALGKKLTIFREPRQHPEAHRRLIEMLSEVGVHQQATFEDIEAEIGEAVNFIVHVERQPGRRAIREVLRLDGYDRQAQEFRFEMVYGGLDSAIKGELAHA